MKVCHNTCIIEYMVMVYCLHNVLTNLIKVAYWIGNGNYGVVFYFIFKECTFDVVGIFVLH